MNIVLSIILYGILGTIFFYIGFITGSIVDSIYYRIYTHIDPKENNNGAIIGIVTLQIFTLIVIQIIVNRIPTPDGYEMIHSIFDFGYLFSQLYIGEFAMKKFSSIIYDRHTSENTSLLENLPAIGNIFNKDHTRSSKDKPVKDKPVKDKPVKYE